MNTNLSFASFDRWVSGVIVNDVLAPAELPQPERRARAFGAEPGRADPIPQPGIVPARTIFSLLKCNWEPEQLIP